MYYNELAGLVPHGVAAGHSEPDGSRGRREVADNPRVPRLASFYGIVIWMYRPDHPPPHFHADNWTRAQALEPLVPIEPLP
jgi:hypothetical protein